MLRSIYINKKKISFSRTTTEIIKWRKKKKGLSLSLDGEIRASDQENNRSLSEKKGETLETLHRREFN